MLTRLDYSSALEYRIIRRYTNTVYYYTLMRRLVRNIYKLLSSESVILYDTNYEYQPELIP